MTVVKSKIYSLKSINYKFYSIHCGKSQGCMGLGGGNRWCRAIGVQVRWWHQAPAMAGPGGSLSELGLHLGSWRGGLGGGHHTDPWLSQGAWWSVYLFMHFC